MDANLTNENSSTNYKWSKKGWLPKIDVQTLMICGKDSFAVRLGYIWQAINFDGSTFSINTFCRTQKPQSMEMGYIKLAQDHLFLLMKVKNSSSIIPLKQLRNCFAYEVQRVVGKLKVKLWTKFCSHTQKKGSIKMVQVKWNPSFLP